MHLQQVKLKRGIALCNAEEIQISPDPPVIQKPLDKSRGFFFYSSEDLKQQSIYAGLISNPILT
jgi:hypothetical protein